MKKVFLGIFLVLSGLNVYSQTPSTELVLDTKVTKPRCLTQVLNQVFSGTEFAVLSAPRHGTVYSWNCWNAEKTGYTRYAVVVTRQFMLNPTCSTLGISTFRKAEGTAATSVYNMIRSCGRIPIVKTPEWDSYVRLLTIGHQQPVNQEATAKFWFGDNFRVEQTKITK